MNSEEQKQADVISELTSSLVDAEARASQAETKAAAEAKRTVFGMKIVLVLVIVVAVIYLSRERGHRDTKDAAQSIALSKQEEALLVQKESLLIQERINLAQKIYAMSVFWTAQIGNRFSWEKATELCKINDLVMPKPDHNLVIPHLKYWPDHEYEIFQEIVKEDPSLLRKQEKLIELFNERLAELHEESD